MKFALLFLLLAGCASKPLPPVPHRKAAIPQPQAVTKSMTIGHTVTVAWDLLPNANPDMLVTGLKGSTNLTDWYQLATMPYTNPVQVTLTNRPELEFYRAFTGWK